MNYFSIPGFQKIKIFEADPNGALRHRARFISIDVKNKYARISKGAADLMELSPRRRFAFIMLGDRVYCSLSNFNGNKLSVCTRGDMQIRCSEFVEYIKRNFTISKTFKCNIIKTNCFYDGFKLWELEFPYDKRRKYDRK